MTKIDKLIKSINLFIFKADDNATEGVPEFPAIDQVPKLVEDFETAIAGLLRRQRKWLIDELNTFVSKDDKIVLEAFLVYLKSDLFATDDFAEEFGDEAAGFLQSTVEELARAMMDSIDPDIQLGVVSKRTTDWIKHWSADLGELMQLSTHEALEKELLQAIEAG
jgi:hypothetical protein